MQSHDINATSPTTTQRVSLTFSTVQHDCLTLKMEATKPFEHPELLHIPQGPNLQHALATPLTEPSPFLSARPHSMWERFDPSWTEVPTFDVCEFSKSVWKVQVILTPDNYNSTLHEDRCTFKVTTRRFLHLSIFSYKILYRKSNNSLYV